MFKTFNQLSSPSPKPNPISKAVSNRKGVMFFWKLSRMCFLIKVHRLDILGMGLKGEMFSRVNPTEIGKLKDFSKCCYLLACKDNAMLPASGQKADNI